MPEVPRPLLRQKVHQVTQETPVLDMHTHLYAPAFGKLLLWGIDELLTYHYLIAEVFRVAPIPYQQFWDMTKQQQADHIWKHLFVERTPVSEAARGVLTVLHAFGLDTNAKDLEQSRNYFAMLNAEEYVDKVLNVANIRSVVMTNDPFDNEERPVWQAGQKFDRRFQAALRIDPLLNNWNESTEKLEQLGYKVTGDLGEADRKTVRRFLDDWIKKTNPRYLAVSLPPDFKYPEDSPRSLLLEHCVLPAACEADIPFAMMTGVNRQVNPQLRLAADGVGKADVRVVECLCRDFPDNRFLVTMLSRENQHELCVTARKFNNLLLFGCWWFLNNPSIIEEMTRERLEMLGLSFMPQHSDARVLDQLIYKWTHSRKIIADVLADKYEDLADAGRKISEEDIRRDVADLLGNVFDRFCSS